MLYRRTGIPEDGETVLCKVTKVYPDSVFANLEEFGNISGMINIAEVSAGRIRNLRDFVSEGKIVYCKVLRIDMQRRHIELSLRRVSESMKLAKATELKKEQTAEKIIEFIAQKHKKDLNLLYHEIASKILPKYRYLYEFFEEVSRGEKDVSSVGISKELADELDELIKQRLKPQEIKLEGNITLSTFIPDGVSLIRGAFEIVKNKNIEIRYLGGSKYKMEITDVDFKNAEKILKSESEKIMDYVRLKDKEAVVSFEKVEHKG